jgi:hypothetical protein
MAIGKTTSSPPITQLCPDGDLTLIVGPDGKPPVHRFRVSKSTLCLASPVWRAMLTGRFVEAGQDEIPLIDDDFAALLIVLYIAHLKVHKVPKTLPMYQLVQVATVCDKYDTVAICRPYVSEWVKLFLSDNAAVVTNHGAEKFYLFHGNEQWLWIAWVFGYQEEFARLANKLRLTIWTDRNGSCFTEGPNQWAPTTTLQSNMPSDIIGMSIRPLTALRASMWAPFVMEFANYALFDFDHYANKSPDSLLKLRQSTMASLLAIFYEYVDRVIQGHSCKAYPGRRDYQGRFQKSENQNAICCRSLTLGLLMTGFESLGDCYAKPVASSINCSVSKLYQVLKAIKLQIWEDKAPLDYRSSRRTHTQCDFTSEMMTKLDDVYNAVGSPVTDTHIRHLEKQHAKGRTSE